MDAPLTTPEEPGRLPPSIERGETPQFFLLNTHPKKFERMSAAIFDREPNIRDADLFNLDGDPQYGIDILANRLDGQIEVGSCKCYENIQPREIRIWADDFLGHWDSRWKAKKVRRFVLICAAPGWIRETVRNQIKLQQERFALLGVEFEFWGPEQIVRRLQPHRSIVLRYLGEPWANELCGTVLPPPEPSAFPAGGIAAFQVAQLSELQTALSGQALQRVADARAALRRGDLDTVEALIAELQADRLWSQLTPEAQARVLRLAGSLSLQRNDADRAKSLAAQARELSPAEPRLETHIALHEGAGKEAFKVLGEPSTRDGRQLLAAMHLQFGDLDDAADIISKLVSEAPDDAESLRLQALLQLTLGERSKALEAATEAEVLAPDWRAVIRAGAIVRYANALSPVVGPQWYFHPNPIDADLVKRDDTSQDLLRKALSAFQGLAASSTDATEDTNWCLACLSNLGDRRDDAEKLCIKMLGDDPTNAEAVAWALARGFKIDRGPSLTSLQSRYQDASASTGQVNALAWLMGDQSGNAQTADFLMESLSIQADDVAREASSLAARLRGGTRAETDEDEGAGGAPSLPSDFDERRAKSVHDGDWTWAENLANEMFCGEQVPSSALSLAQMLAAYDRWSALREFIPGILRFETASAVTLAAHIAINTGQPAEARRILNDTGHLFPRGTLPLELRRIEVAAAAALGDVKGALTSAERLASETQDFGDRLQRAHLLLAVGDAHSAISIVRDALDSGQLKAFEALQYSHSVARDDPNLARDLWRFAVARGVDERFVTNALTQAYQLGLDHETGPLMPLLKARAESGAGDVWMVTLDEVIEQMKDRRSKAKDIAELFEAGAIPNHLLQQATNANFAELFDLNPGQYKAGPLRPILMRHGARPLEGGVTVPWDQWRVRMDISAVLLADQLGLLDLIEALPNPACVSPELPAALLDLEHRSAPHQPAHVQASRDILAAHSAGQLSVVATEPPSPDAVVRHEAVDAAFGTAPSVSLHSVVDSLLTGGLIDQARHRETTDRLGDIGFHSEAPLAHQRLLFSDNTLESLSVSGVLNEVLVQFCCEIGSGDFDRIVAEVADADERTLLANRLLSLRQRIARGLEQGRFVLLPRHDLALGRDRKSPAIPLEHCLFDVIMSPQEANAINWVDDRLTSGYAHSSGGPIVGVVDVLNALVEGGLLSTSDRNKKLSALRAGGALFIPMSSGEVLPALKAAPIIDGEIVETPTLAILRRSFALGQQMDRCLKFGTSIHESLKERPDETPFLLDQRRLLGECLQELWAATPTAECVPRANWLWSSLRAELPTRDLPGDSAAARHQLSALNLAGLIEKGYLLAVPLTKESVKQRKAYFQWIDAVAIAPRVRMKDTAFLDKTAELLAEFVNIYSGSEAEKLTTAEAEIATKLITIYIQELPDELRQRLYLNPNLSIRSTLRLTGMTTVGRFRFDTARFWRALRQAGRYGKAKLRTLKGRRIIVRRVASGFRLSGRGTHILGDEIVSIVVQSVATRAPHIEAFLARLDLPFQDKVAALAAANAAGSPGALAITLEEARKASVVHHYRRINDQFRAKRVTVQLEDLQPPRADRLLNYLRLEKDAGSVAQQAERLWPTLVSEIGRQFAFRRLGSLPVPIASTVAREMRASSAEGEFGLIAAGLRSPILRIQVAKLSRELGRSAADQSTKLAEAIDATSQAGALFDQLTAWAERCFMADSHWLELPTDLQLALVWFHADRLTDILMGNSIDPTAAAKNFRENTPYRPISAGLQRVPSYSEDCLAPDSLSVEALLYHGLGYILGNQEARDTLPEPVLSHVLDTITFKPSEGVTAPHLRLLLRSANSRNGLSSFMKERPIGLVEVSIVPEFVREEELNGLLDALQTEPNSPENWFKFAAIARPVLDPLQRAKLDEAFSGVEFTKILGGEIGPAICRIVVDIRRRFGGPLDDDALAEMMFDLSRHWAAKHRVPHDWRRADQACQDALVEILELMIAASRDEAIPIALQRLEHWAHVMVAGWPAAAPLIRAVLDGFHRDIPVADGVPIWRAFASLKTWP